MTRIVACCLLWAAAAPLAAQSKVPAKAAPPIVDVVFRGATIYDGAGGQGFTGDVGLRSGRIVFVGELPADAKIAQTIDCRGLAIAPGFIDLHNHSDSPIVTAATRANVNYLTQGCTTIVTGNCGFGPVDVAAYLARIDEKGAGTNVAHLLPHGDLRDAALGKAGREPTSVELTKMRELADKAMRDGAWGMSTGLIYVPGTYAKTEEIVEIAKVVGRHGGIYASHIRNEGTQLLAAVEEALKIGRDAELPVHVSHFKASGRNAWGTLHVAAEMIEKERAAGRLVTADQYPYTASSTSLEATLLPAWSREGGRRELEKRLRDPATRAKIRAAVEKELAGKVRLQIAGYGPRRDFVGKSVEEIAAQEKREPVEMVLEMEANGGARVVNFGMNEDDVRQAMRLPWVATASDGSAKVPDADQPHPRSFGTFTRKLGVYALKEQVVPLEQAVRSSSGLPADILGLADRGYLKPGQAADVVIFDPKQIADRATYDKPYEYSVGVRYVYVNGVPAVYEGVPTGALAGRALRHVSRLEKSDSQ
ncbi:MAG: D-aminoacylase [Planctomycetaceae bacterium]|nr:D-aminoacylase [Planctomycetaceae bacterium]